MISRIDSCPQTRILLASSAAHPDSPSQLGEETGWRVGCAEQFDVQGVLGVHPAVDGGVGELEADHGAPVDQQPAEQPAHLDRLLV